MMDDLKFWGGMVSALVAVIGVIMLIGIRLEAMSCEQKWQDSGMESQYGLLSGCRVKVDGGWIPSSAYRDIDQ